MGLESQTQDLMRDRDEMTALACRAFKVLEAHQLLSSGGLGAEDLAWWANHKAEDARKEREAEAARADEASRKALEPVKLARGEVRQFKKKARR